MTVGINPNSKNSHIASVLILQELDKIISVQKTLQTLNVIKNCTVMICLPIFAFIIACNLIHILWTVIWIFLILTLPDCLAKLCTILLHISVINSTRCRTPPPSNQSWRTQANFFTQYILSCYIIWQLKIPERKPYLLSSDTQPSMVDVILIDRKGSNGIPREHWRFFSLRLPAMDGCGIFLWINHGFNFCT